ncbi:MAG: esterase family protein [Bacteroidales bacterium]|nr:esterase family protein [Bacteroidales bacterium]
MMRKPLLTLILTLCIINLHAQDLIVIKSANLKCNDSILVFTPVNDSIYHPNLFLLHGWSGNYKNWSEKYDLQEISNRSGFRIICPDGFYNSWYVNSSDKDGMQWRTFFDEELYPLMKEKYNLDPKTTFITGLSMGGHGSINIFIDNPDRFAAAGSMSGVLNIHHTTLIEKYVTKVLGEYTPENRRYDEESAINRVKKMVGLDKIMILSCGYSDYYAKSTYEFAEKCRELGIPYVMTISPGKHSWKFWGFALEQQLWLFNKIIKGENLGY